MKMLLVSIALICLIQTARSRKVSPIDQLAAYEETLRNAMSEPEEALSKQYCTRRVCHSRRARRDIRRTITSPPARRTTARVRRSEPRSESRRRRDYCTRRTCSRRRYRRATLTAGVRSDYEEYLADSASTNQDWVDNNDDDEQEMAQTFFDRNSEEELSGQN